MTIHDMIQEVSQRDIFVNGIEFGEDEVMLHYQEKVDVGESTVITKHMVLLMDTEERQQMFIDLQTILGDMIDEGYVNLRDPKY